MEPGDNQITQIGFIALGDMEYGVALNISQKPQYRVVAYNRYKPRLQRFVTKGGHAGQDPKEVATNSDFLICMADDAQQVENILFDKVTGAVQVLPKHAVVLICSTINPEFFTTVSHRLEELERSDIFIMDCPVSGDKVRAADGTLTIFASGSEEALDRSQPVLEAMSEKFYRVPGGVGAASKVNMVNQLLVGIHVATAAEAMALAVKAGLDTRGIYHAICDSAGSSWAFQNRVPHMLEGDWTPRSALDILVKDMDIIMSSARASHFPLPLSSTVEQLYILGSSQGYGEEDDAGIVRVYLRGMLNGVKENAYTQTSDSESTGTTLARRISEVAILGLGSMGQGMAASLLRAGYTVKGYDLRPVSMDKFLSHEGDAVRASSVADAVKDCEVVVMMVQNAAQIEDILFGSGSAAASLSEGSILILSSTVPPAYSRSLGEKLDSLKKGIDIVDAPVSGGVRRAEDGTLKIFCSGRDVAVAKANEVLLSMAGTQANIYHVKGGVGAASSVKMINQLLAGVHIAAAAEAMAFTARIGLDPKVVFEILKHSAGWSWMLENRGPQMLDADWTPYSALSIFVKDMGIVIDEAKRLKAFVPISSAAYGLYLSGAAHGFSNEADAGVVRFWDLIAGVSVAGSKH